MNKKYTVLIIDDKKEKFKIPKWDFKRGGLQCKSIYRCHICN